MSQENRINVKVKNNEKMYYTVAEKESRSGLRFIDTMIVMFDDKFFGYIPSFDENNPAISCDPKKIKKRVNIKEISKLVPKDRQLTIFFSTYDKGKKEETKWIFRFPTAKLATEWTELLDKSNSPFPSRTPTEHQKIQAQLSPRIQNNPSIKQLIKAAEMLDKKGEVVKKQEVEVEEKGRERKSDLSQKPFSFQGDEEAKDMMKQENHNFSPQKKENKDQGQGEEEGEMPVARKLEKRVDFNLIEEELSTFKKSISNIKKSKEVQFSQLSSIIGKRKDLYSLNFLNYFRQPKQDVDDEKYQDFYHLCKQLAEDLSTHRDELNKTENLLEEVRRNNGININILNSDLKQIPGDNQVCDEGQMKSFLNRFKNMDYLWRIISNDEQLRRVFRMPMNCIIEYQGIIFYFVCTFSHSQRSASQNEDIDYFEYFQRLSDVSMVNKLAMEKQKSVKFTPFSRTSFVISEVNQYLPMLLPTSKQIRPELFLRLIDNGKIPEPYKSKKGKKEEDQQSKILREPIAETLEVVSKNLNKIQEYIVHPREFSTLLHVYGLNVNMLSQIYNQIENTFMKEILKTEAAVRSFKMIYRKKMQESNNNNNEQLITSEQKKNLYDRITKGMLNVLLGTSQQSELIWKIVTLHSQMYFHVSVQKSQINKGYLLMGLEHHLGINISSAYESCDQIFKVGNFVNSVRFEMKIKVCQLFWADQLENSVESCEQLIRTYQLRERNFPYHIYQDRKTYESILDLISQFYGPNSVLSHLEIYKTYESPSQLTLLYHRRKISQIKWLIKQGVITMSEVQTRLNQLSQPLSFYFGHHHPFFTEVCDILVALYEQNRSYQEAFNFCKKSLANTIQLCGGNNMHIKLAANFYQTGECLQLWGKIDQSVAQYKKAKNILEFNQYTNQREYSLVLLRLACLYLAKFKDQECFKLLLNCLQIFVEYTEISENIEEICEALSLMNRCQADLPLRTQTIMKNSMFILQNLITNRMASDENFIKILKIIIECYFLENKKKIDNFFIQFLENLSDQVLISVHQAQKDQAIKVLEDFVANGLLYQTLDNFDTKSKGLSQSKGKMMGNTNANFENFEKLTMCLLVVMGEGFLLGVVENSRK